MKITNDWVNVSHSIGAPFGAIGTGYGVFGKFGFVRPNFNGTPDAPLIKSWRDEAHNNYIEPINHLNKNFISLNFKIGDEVYSVQSQKTDNTTEILADNMETYAFLPFSKHIATYEKLGLEVDVLFYSPLIPHDLKESTTPASCINISLKNIGENDFDGDLFFTYKDEKDAGLKVSFVGGDKVHFSLPQKSEFITDAFIAWYYPEFKTSSPKATDNYIRYYTEKFKNVDEVFQYAKLNHNNWKQKIENWQDSIGMPSEFKRMWFNSLSSVMTSTMMDKKYFFEIESPHFWINTMDVTIYSAWLYMINWPEIEKMDMYQYKEAIDTNPEDKKGFVWHSLWTDGTHYVEEPCFITRIYRDYLWYNDKKFLNDLSNTVEDALNRVYTESYDSLIESIDGNQSYDMWKMPGVCTYVNMTWLYALYSAIKMSKAIGKDLSIDGIDTKELLEKAKKSFIKYLWNDEHGYFNAFSWTEKSKKFNVGEAVFSDQMFGRWLLLIEKDLDDLISIDRIKSSLNFIYENNYIEDKENGVRGWTNGMLRNKVVHEQDTHSSFANTWWLGAQLDLSSLLGELGEEEKALDVFYAVEESLKNNHLAVGEWNLRTSPDGKPYRSWLPKDTPSFPAYPRYKCCWEMLVRILGLKMDENVLELTPFKSFDFYLNEFIIAGCKLTVNVQKNWNKIFVDGVEQSIAVFDRNVYEHKIDFLNC